MFQGSSFLTRFSSFQIEQNPFVGFVAIAIAVICSGFAGKTPHRWNLVLLIWIHIALTRLPVWVLRLCGPGVYFEKVLKSSDTSLWVRNIQMYISGIAVTLFGVYVTDAANVMEKGFFFGYTPWVCFVVCKWPTTHAGTCLRKSLSMPSLSYSC